MDAEQPNEQPEAQLLSYGAHRMSGEIAHRCPEWSVAAGEAFDELLVDTRLIIDNMRRLDSTQAKAVMGIFAQAASDFCDLLVDVASGRGRPALRAARSLVEEHVTVLDCASDLEAAARWLDSAPIADLAIRILALPERHLFGNVRKSYRHRVEVAGKPAERAVAEAEAQWGGGFRFSWHTKSMRQRAEAHGLEDSYEFYRLASAPVHASSGGSVGLRQVRSDGGPTVRTGFALELAPLAILYGTAAMRGVLTAVEQFVPSGLPRALSALAKLDHAWQEFHEGIRYFDRQLWPSDEPVNRAALIVVEADNTSACYEYLPELWKSRPIRSADLRIDTRQGGAVDALIQRLESAPHGRVGIFVHEATPLVPPEDGKWWDFNFDLDEEVHVLTDGTFGIVLEEDASS